MASQESQLIRQLLRQAMLTMTGEFDIQAARRGLDSFAAYSPPAPDIKVEKVMVGEIPAEWITAPNAAVDRAMLYLHGGAYIMGSLTSHRDLASKLSRATGTQVLLLDYRLAPEHSFPAPLEDALFAYRWLISSGFAAEKIVIGGDSAGGGLTLATLLSLRDAGEALPLAAILLSAWTDLEGTGESMESRKDVDPWLAPQLVRLAPALYISDMDRRNPLVSPIYGDLSGLPPMIVQVGNDEILLDDSIRLVDRARAAGVEVEVKIFDEMWHVFQCFPIPEAKAAIEEIGKFVVRQFEK